MPVCGIFVPVVQAHVMSMLDGLLHYSAHPDVSPPPPPWWKIEIPAHQNSILPTIETWVRSCVNNLMIDQSNTTSSLHHLRILTVWKSEAPIGFAGVYNLLIESWSTGYFASSPKLHSVPLVYVTIFPVHTVTAKILTISLLAKISGCTK